MPASPGAFAGIRGIVRPGLGLSASVAAALRVAGLDLLDHPATLAEEHRPWERAVAGRTIDITIAVRNEKLGITGRTPTAPGTGTTRSSTSSPVAGSVLVTFFVE
jgi:hypothetical protein